MVYDFRRQSDSRLGAILVSISPAHKKLLHDIDEVKRFITLHAKTIYKYANSIRPIGKDESLYIITGCINTASWAMAAYSEHTDPSHSRLRLEPIRSFENGIPSVFEWTIQDASRARTGKSEQGDVKDQSLFLQGFKLAFSLRFRSRMESCHKAAEESKGSELAPGCSKNRGYWRAPLDGGTHPVHTESQISWRERVAHSGSSSDTFFPSPSANLTDDPSEGNSASEVRSFGSPYRSRMASTISSPNTTEDSGQPYHPSDVVNAHLLQKV